jgi:hypothetical protein
VLVPAALNPKEPEVFAYAVEYIKIRSWGIMAAMLGFVASGSYRGIKDTGTPLKAAMIAAATNLVLTPFLIIGGCRVLPECGVECVESQYTESNTAVSATESSRQTGVCDCAWCWPGWRWVQATLAAPCALMRHVP